MGGDYHGCLWTGTMDGRALRKFRRRARAIDGDAVVYTLGADQPGGAQGWVSIPNRGEPFDSSIMRKIRAEFPADAGATLRFP